MNSLAPLAPIADAREPSDEMVLAAWNAFDAAAGYSKPERIRAVLRAATPSTDTRIADAVRRIAQETMQVHGGRDFTTAAVEMQKLLASLGVKA